jgi:hypothetical protein
VLDTKALKSKNLVVRLTATQNGKTQVRELKLNNKADKVEWVDARVIRGQGSGNRVEITVRPGFSDGGISKPFFGKPNPAITPLSFYQLKNLAKSGIEKYWSRDGSRANGIGTPIKTAKGVFAVNVKVELDVKPDSDEFNIKERLDEDEERSRSAFGMKIVHNAGFWYTRTLPPFNFVKNYADQAFEYTSAHEFGHIILLEYGGKGYSWEHKGTSYLFPQDPRPNHPFPATGEIDLIHYFSSSVSIPDKWVRSSASEQDVKGLIWLNRIVFGI